MIAKPASHSTSFQIATRSDRTSDARAQKAWDRVTIVSSTVDPASKNIAQNLISEYDFTPSETRGLFRNRDGNICLVTVEKPCIYVEPSDIRPDGSPIIFASKHVSSANKLAMTVHATGNLTSDAEFGGKPNEVAYVDPLMIRRALRGLKQRVAGAGLEIEVTMEATHHGPTSFKDPVCFVEIGSTPNEWTNPELGKIAAGAIMDATTTEHETGKTAVGFGGTHYSPKFTRICLKGDVPIGHFVPKHAFESGITDSIIRETFEKTVGNSGTALVDWKGLNGDERRKLTAKLETWGYKVERC